MKTIAKIVGALFLLVGLLQTFKYVMSYSNLTPYGKGFVLGSVLLILFGGLLIFWGFRKRGPKA
jgi:hypothetical protein